MGVFFTSDTHFGHKNIIRYCNRPFNNVEEMDEYMIRVWNEEVNHDDIIFHLGDFSFYNTSKSKEIYDRLNGHKIIIRGNHDKTDIVNLFDEHYSSYDYLKDAVDSYSPVLDFNINFTHIPRMPNPSSAFRHYLCGHVHTNWASLNSVIPSDRGLVFNYYLNVGIDVWHRPISLNAIINQFKSEEATKDLAPPVGHLSRWIL